MKTMLLKNSALSAALAGSLVLGTSGCGKKEDDATTTADLCREDCDRIADECPEGSFAAETVALCRFFCSSMIDSKECRDKWTDYSDCRASHAIDCNSGSLEDPTACEEAMAPFVSSFDVEGNQSERGECVDEQ